MRYLLALVLVVSMVGAAAAYDLGNARPEKTEVYPDYVNPDVRQGGDTVDDATVIDAIPYYIEGTTAGYTDDYDEACPYYAPDSPDVVYTFTPTYDVAPNIDLCGSLYDTKLYVYDAELNLIACNDDYYTGDPCGIYVSALFGVPLYAGMQYYIIIDGYGGDYGDYILSIIECVPQNFDCPPEGFPEGEPDLVDDYVDDFNGGCNSDGPPWPFQSLTFGPAFIDFCGVAGWYTFQGSDYRDTDWFTAVVGENGFIEIYARAESATTIFELDIADGCSASVLQTLTIDICSPGTMTVFGAPGSVVFLWAGSTNYTNPGDVQGNMYDYILTIDGLEGSATESSTWSQVKGLYR
jgi:hypothetical protein